jgi:hypothetical protein
VGELAVRDHWAEQSHNAVLTLDPPAHAGGTDFMIEFSVISSITFRAQRLDPRNHTKLHA